MRSSERFLRSRDPRRRLLLWRTAVVLAIATVLTSCASTGRSDLDTQKSKQDGEAALLRVFGVPGSDWPAEQREAEPAPTVCTFNGDAHAGVQYHWFVNGSAASHPTEYIAAVGEALREGGYTVQFRETDYGKYGTLHEAVARGESLPTVAASANTRGSSIMLDSVCVAGDAEKLGSTSDRNVALETESEGRR
jgi:hypothetical protein